jgi:hypothetical protein
MAPKILQTTFLSLPCELRQGILFLALKAKLEIFDQKLKLNLEAGTCHCPPRAIVTDKTDDQPFSLINEASSQLTEEPVNLHKYCRPRRISEWLRSMESVDNIFAQDIEVALVAWTRLMGVHGSDVVEHSAQDNKKALILTVCKYHI